MLREFDGIGRTGCGEWVGGMGLKGIWVILGGEKRRGWFCGGEYLWLL